MSSRLLAGRYELLEKIGDGGMAIVYKAKCKVLNRYVAIKILKPEFTKDVKFIENFRRESQAAASLTHPNIVNVYDVGKDGNINYIVMELIEGKVLSDIIKEEGPMEAKRAISITKQIALALSFAHKNQIIHRDVKPHNILITENDVAKITDFGIAKAVNSATIVGQTGIVMGSVHYFSPEQARGGYVDEKSDIYSLGIVLYELLTGKVPFDADNPVAVAVMHMNEEIVPPSKLVPSIIPELEEVVMKATNKYQTSRYKTADEMYEALDRAAFSMLGLTGEGAQYMYKGMGTTMTMEAVNNNITKKQELPKEEEKEHEENMREKVKTKDRNNNGKKKFRLNKIKVLAIILALICAIPASQFILSAVEGFGKEKEVEVPKLVGMTISEAEKTLEDKNLECEVEDKVTSSEYEEGRIVSQDPPEGMKIKTGQTIKVNVSKGLEYGTVPDVTNKSLEDAIFSLKAYGFDKGEVTIQDSELDENVVISQSPKGNTEQAPGTTIDLVVSNGKYSNLAEMPNLLGLSLEKAKAEIKKAGLQVGEIGEESSQAYEKDKVMWQQYEAGQELNEGSTVNIKISKGSSEPEGPKDIKLTIDYNEAKNEVFFLTVVISDENGVRTVCSGEERFRSNGSEEFTLTGTGKGTVTVIFDNDKVIEKKVNFNSGEIS
ncbi:Stk1 family PASTA domain-containing Ser/Thr kinase [Anaerovorax odorimutans]|uniref:Stk1 family PASTA domain-containing Ser/Thr kinase n=1 Tax=Anaerovorax odorimutans TaxID=109327 RepID=UPI000410BBBB|nr:Stk1 family PASTA domain-containing Ser/Thr kinase [Anaerovorax odorimutans]